MDKYEYNLKIDQMKTLCAEENYESAAEIADTINWNKVKNVNALVRAGEVYEKVERYEESRDILLMAYDRSPIGRMIIFRLAEVAIKMKDFAAAQEYYDEFVEIAPHDNLKYILRYELKKGQGADIKELITILEELKEQEYTEEWSYELAYLYHRAGMSENCIDACDELILWFGDGPYVERALELKMLYQPLTKAQEEKYRRFRYARDGITQIDAGEMMNSGEFIHDTVEIPQVSVSAERYNTVNLQEEIAKGMEQIIGATKKETVSDTMDNIKKIVEDIPYLQLPRDEEPKEEEQHIETDEEIDGSLKTNFQELLGEDSDGQISLVMDEKTQIERQITGQLTIADVLDEWEKTKRAAETVLQEAEQRKLESAKARALLQAEDIMGRLNDVIPKLDAGISPKALLEEEYLQAGPVPEEPEVSQPQPDFQPEADIVPEIPGSEAEPAPGEDVFAERESGLLFRQGARPGETVLFAPELNPEAEAEAQPEELISEPKPVMEEPPKLGLEPETEAKVWPEPQPMMEEPSEPELEPEAEAKTWPESQPMMEEPSEPELEPEAEAKAWFEPEGQIPEPQPVMEESFGIEPEPRTERKELIPEEPSEPELNPEAEAKAWPEPEELPPLEPESEDDDIEKALAKELDAESEPRPRPEPKPVFRTVNTAKPAGRTEAGFDKIEQIVREELGDLPESKPQFSDTKKLLGREILRMSQTTRMDFTPEDLDQLRRPEKPKVVYHLTPEQKAVFSYFVPVKGMEDQLARTLKQVSRHLEEGSNAGTGNIIIQGGQGCGKTVLATSIIKALQKETGCPNGKIGKIDAAALNKKDIQLLLRKVEGGCLIIERAGELSREAEVTLSLLLEHDKSGILIILEDTSKGIRKALSLNESFAKMFTEKIDVPIFTNDDLVVFAKSYSHELGYEIDEVAVLALYNRISSIQRLDQSTTITEVKEIVDEAIEREARRGIKKAFSILTAKRYTDDDRILLREKDFE